MIKSCLLITMLITYGILTTGCASSKNPDGGFIPASYDVPIDLDVQNQQNSPNL
ncbi:hypothetical protein [Aquella oligotrophica]|uniref:hypothetical protein n=1 Tax=Aquella oligotrophica TaxID=2067065 RepID=UPI001315687E|nr:hypothetical protein [Aquella oligotrophica]